MPATLAPQLASLASAAPTSGAWSWEIKFDGYRLMARIEDGNVRLITRGGHDWSAKMPALVKALQSLKLKSAWLDGEIVVLGENGTPDFNALQNAFDRSRTEAIDYFLFDLPYFEGHDLRATPLRAAAATAEAAARRAIRTSTCASAPTSTPTPASILRSGAAHGPGRRDRQARGRALRIAPHARPG